MRPLVLSTGSNLGDRQAFLQAARKELSKIFGPLFPSRVVESAAVDYTNQPDFLNQVLEFQSPELAPQDIMNELLRIELKLGRRRNIPKGPRTIDIDFLFLGTERWDTPDLQLPHPRLFERPFILEPLQDLPCYPFLERHFNLIKGESHEYR